jgi:hypothetical protein
LEFVISLFNDPHDCQHQIVNLEMAALGLPPNKSLDASGGGMFRKIIGATMLE